MHGLGPVVALGFPLGGRRHVHLERVPRILHHAAESTYGELGRRLCVVRGCLPTAGGAVSGRGGKRCVMGMLYVRRYVDVRGRRVCARAHATGRRRGMGVRVRRCVRFRRGGACWIWRAGRAWWGVEWRREGPPWRALEFKSHMGYSNNASGRTAAEEISDANSWR